MIFFFAGRMGRLAEGVSGASDFKENFRGPSKSDIAGHFSQPEYAILRPAEFRGDFGRTGNRNLVYRCVSFNQHHHIEDCPCGELIEHERGVGRRKFPPFDRLDLGNDTPTNF